MKSMLQKKGSTLFLRVAILAIGAVVLLICALTLPTLWSDDLQADPEYGSIAYALFGLLIAMYVSVVPFFYALYQAWQLLGYVDKGKAFSMSSVAALKRIAYCAVAISVVYAASLPFIFVWAQNDDAPGLVIIGMMFVGAPLVIAVFAAVLQRLFREAIAIKSEVDLTV